MDVTSHNRILLIQANADRPKEHYSKTYAKIYGKLFLIPSLTLYQVAACTPLKYQIDFIDERFENTRFDEDYDLIGISAATKDAYRAYEIADKFRENGKKVVLGGMHPTLLPEEAKQHADSVVVGEAEEIWPELLKDFEKGRMKKIYRWKRKVPPDRIPPARRSDKYTAGAVQATRGCPYRCEFCQLTGLEDFIHRKRPIKSVVKEIKEMDKKLIWFQDASLTIDPAYTKKLLKEIIRERIKIRWIAFGNSKILARDDDLLRLAKESGCVAWMVGFETISDVDLKKNAGVNFYNMVKKVGKYGMGVWGSFVFGFDRDTPEVFDLTYDEISSWGLECAEFNILTPLPKTPLFERMEREDRILTKDWSKYDYDHVVFQPKNMSPKELKEGIKRISRRFYSAKDIILRILGGSANRSLSLYSIILKTFSNLDLRKFHQIRF